MLHQYKFSGGKEAGIIIPVPAKEFEPPTSLRSLAGSRPDRCLPLGHWSLWTAFLSYCICRILTLFLRYLFCLMSCYIAFFCLIQFRVTSYILYIMIENLL